MISVGMQAYVGAKCVSFYFDVEHSLFNVRVEVLQSVLMSTTVVWINAESSLLSRVVDANRVLARAMFLNSKRSRPDSHDSRVSVITNRSAHCIIYNCSVLHETDLLRCVINF